MKKNNNKKHLYMLDQAQNRKTFSNCQATYQKELCMLFGKSGNFFHRANVQIGLTPAPPVYFCLLFKESPPPCALNVLFEWPLIIMSNANKLEICLGEAWPSSICCHYSVNSLVFIICSKIGVSVCCDSFSWEKRLWILECSKF